MSSITNVNQNSSVVNVGRTTPVTPGSQTADKSIPVVMASDQTSIPVVEQNKVQSEVALSLLGIPRAEIALGIFADVNTYDVNPSEWSMKPEYHIAGGVDKQAIGIKHLPTEAGALVEASRNKVAVLTSKRFFRYQPGRVSAATFGVKSSVSEYDHSANPPIRKFGIYDKYDGYYWETRNNGEGDNFSVVRRTQSLQYGPVSPYGVGGSTNTATALRGEDMVDPSITRVDTTQIDDYRIVGMGADEKEDSSLLEIDRKYLAENKFALIDAALNTATSAYPTAATIGDITVQSNSTNTIQVAEATLSNAATNKERFYTDLALAATAAIDWKGSTPLFTAATMEAKCKRDLEYWIDNFILDLEYGGDAHTTWNTTNFAIANSANGFNAWSNPTRGVGIFPKVSLFEAPIHAALLANITAGTTLTGLGTEAQARLVTLQTIVATAFGDAQNAGYTDNFVIPSLQDGDVDYGTKSKLDTFFDVKRNFWSYYVTVKKAEQTVATGELALVAGKKYTITATGEDNPWAELDEGEVGQGYYVGKVFEAAATVIPANFSGGAVMETITYSPASFGTSSTTDGSALAPFVDLTPAEIEKVIQDKCQRDVGYVIDGYKNDTIGGGDAETTYNMSMFVRGTGLSVYSQQDANGDLSEPLRHQHLKDLLQGEVQAFNVVSVADDITDKITHLGKLGDRVVANFGKENVKALVTGKRAFPGNLVTLRDGLIHTHAAIFDPSLIKDAEQIKAVIEAEGVSTASTGIVPTQFKLTSGVVTFSQHVRIKWSGTGPADSSGNQIGAIIQQSEDSAYAIKRVKYGQVLRVKRVIGPKGNVMTLTTADADRTPIALTSAQLDGSATGELANNGGHNLGNIYFELVVPFIFPEDYNILRYNQDGAGNFTSEIMTSTATLTNKANTNTIGDARVFRTLADNINTVAVPRGAMFPYMYAFDDDLAPSDGSGLGEKYVGFINTGLDPTGPNGTNTNVDVIRSQIDNVNFYPEYVNWIKNNVKPEYWGVYEYRVPRSRFSHDALDGNGELAVPKTSYLARGNRNRVFSDIATSPLDGTIARPGQNYSETQGIKEVQSSLYNYDFTKVTMLKIEFSWYGAVGALFLAYVPVGNGEARWVRVHHLRASNQLKIASLGNATLPITYTTYGGGDSLSLGDGEDAENDGEGLDKGYESSSHHIVKYGASYYIDGGDRGTVRLYSHNNDSPVTAIGKQFDNATTALNGGPFAEAIEDEGDETPYIKINTDIDPTFFMGATVTTSSSIDQNIKVVWAKDGNPGKLYLSSSLNAQSGITLLPDRAETIYGIETKKAIRSTREGNLVRNRVQVYPTKMSTANIDTGTVRLRFKKTPIFQTLTAPGGELELNADYAITSENLPLPVTSGSANCLQNGEDLYGWFRGRIGTEGLTVFGRLYKESDNYYFELLGSFEGALTLFNGGKFLPDQRFEADGQLAGGVTSGTPTALQKAGHWTEVTKSSIEKEGLSSVLITSDSVVPIPDTGINVATTYLREGTEQFDLSTYFDYNKEYLSFPLTDIADSLYLAVDSDSATSVTNRISLGVTWEEQ